MTYDFEVEVVDLYVSGEAGGGEPFSSTLTRRLVAEGDVEGAREILGPPAPRRGRRRPRCPARP